MFDWPRHKNILLQILKDIYADTSISPYLGFKGGTAALLFYGLNRNSVDLDFDLLDESKEAEVFEKVRKIVSSYGTVEDSHIKRFNLFNLISYEHGAPKIKVEINRRGSISHYQVKSFLSISMLVMVEPDMFANKLLAMHDRVGKTSRDIFDVYFFCKQGCEVNKEIVEQKSGMSFEEFLSKCIEMLEKVEERHILDGLGELLDEKQKDWARAKLKSETLFLLRLELQTEQERKKTGNR